VTAVTSAARGAAETAAETRAGRPHDAEIAIVAAALEQAIGAADLSIFYRAFRATRLPFLCGEYRDKAELLFPACFDIVHRLGGLSPAVALAVENHFYVTSAIATFPGTADPALERRRRQLVESVVAGRLLVANTNSKIHSHKLGELGTTAKRDGSGFRVNGMAAYTSLATEADLLILLTELEGEGVAFISIPLPRDNPSVEIGPYLFPSAMLDSDTRRITFHDVRLPADALIATAQNKIANTLVPFEMTWHQLLIPALYLGAAARAIEEVRKFLVATEGRDGRALATLDGMITDVGRLALDYQSALCTVKKAADSLIAVRELPRDTDKVEQAVQLASAAKYTGTRAAESIVTAARRIVGARAFTGDCVLERLSYEVMFSSLGPEVSAVIERRYGKLILEGKTFPHPLLS
jgi:alkylation response protein AidB-like acyl-CoA dehydrogenase